MKNFFCLVTLMMMFSFAADAQSEKIKVDAVLKNRFEVSTENGLFRFTVRNSRLGLSGVLTDRISYRFLLELSDEGKFRVMDLAAILSPIENLKISFGQIAVPLFNPDQTSPAKILFANRTFLGKYFTKTRELGVSVAYMYDLGGLPIELQAGLFNGGDMYNPAWTHSVSYSAKIQVGAPSALRGALKFYRNCNKELDYMIWGSELRYARKNYKVETEFFNKKDNLTSESLSACVLQGAYSFPLREDWFFKNIMPALRWDGMSYDMLKSGIDVNRITAGVSFGLGDLPFTSLLRFDYEHYLLKDRVATPIFPASYMHGNKFTVELLLIF